MAVVNWLARKQVWPVARHEIAAAIERGEILPDAKTKRRKIT
jgi:hypothetical protein